MTIVQKLQSVFEKILTQSKLPAPYIPVIKGLVGNYLKDAKDDEIRKYIISLRDELIPWLLEK